MNTTRRSFLMAGASVLPAIGWLRASGRGNRRPRILIRPGTGQRGNIGDIAHTPGALRLFAQHFPEAQFTVWPISISPEAREHLMQSFPELQIVEGELSARGEPSTPELKKAWQEADLLLHGSAPGFKGSDYMPAWRKASQKPYGVFGMTSDPVSSVTADPDGGTLAALRRKIENLPAGHLSASTREILSGAAFVFCRDTLTLNYLQRQGVRSPTLEFGPDATFALRLEDDVRAGIFLREHGLEPGKFLCVIPRLRYTPYHTIRGTKPTASDRAKDEVNARTSGPDHAKFRDLIVRFVKVTGLKVLACPEMSYQLPLAKEVLVDPLPPEVKKNVVWRSSFWLPTEAAAVYKRAMAVLSFECHSPIIALGNGTPALYVRQPTDTIKGQMYHDIGISDWTCEVDETSDADLWARICPLHNDPRAARARVQKVMTRVAETQRRMVDVARRSVQRV